MNTVRRLHKEKNDEAIVLHGGEPLLLPFNDVERILREVYELQGYTAIDTNGTLINDDFIKLFKRYKTTVVLSIDGYYPLNKLRGYPNNGNKCKEYTTNLIKLIETLHSEDIIVGLMVVLHRENAVGERLKQLGKFLINMRQVGVTGGKLITCRMHGYNGGIQLTPEELFNAWKFIAKLSLIGSGIRYDPIPMLLDNLWGVTPPNDCFMSLCDPFHTDRALRIMGDGTVANCSCADPIRGLTIQTEEPSYERYMVLQKLPISKGGCAGCRYWNICFGGCPASSSDWRLRDEYCLTFHKIYDYLESAIRNFEPIFNDRFELATNRSNFPIIIEDKPVHRIIKKIIPSNANNKKTTINGITQVEHENIIEIKYNG
jgi:uncharacterized protein